MALNEFRSAVIAVPGPDARFLSRARDEDRGHASSTDLSA